VNLASLAKTAHARNLRKVAAKDLLPGGKADKIPPSAFPKKLVAEGAKTESEHTSNKTLAKEITRDHLTEDPSYYKKLKKMEKKSSVHLCKECGKTHRPKCDKCGSTRDLRSYHGPCGKCAFGKEAQLAFLDELEKISLDMGTIGGHAAAAAGRFGRSATRFAEGVGKNVGGAAVAFTTPKKSFAKGWDATWHPERLPGGQPLHPVFRGLMGYGLLTGLRDVAVKEDPAGKGHSRVRRALRFAGDQAGGIISAPFGLSGGMLGAMAGGKVGDLAGAAVDKLRGHRPRRQENVHLPPKPQGLQE
jgi:hypothetical protein